MMQLLARLYRLLALTKQQQLSLMRRVQDQFLVGITGIFFNEKNEVLLCKHTYRQIPWSLPGGYLKAKEHPKEGLEREVLEETGLIVSADQRLKIRTDRETARLDICYIGTFIGGEFRPSKEVSEALFFSFENLPLVMKNQLVLIKHALRQIKAYGESSQSVPKSQPTELTPERPKSWFQRFWQLTIQKS